MRPNMRVPPMLWAVVASAALSIGSRSPATVPGQEPQDPPPAPSSASAPAPHAFEGVYELRRRVIDGVVDPKPSTGHLVITRQHLFVCLAAPGPDPELPLLRAGVRTWAPDPDGVSTTVRLGWFTDADGSVQIEKPGTLEKRRVELFRGGLRLYQDRDSHLDFERVE